MLLRSAMVSLSLAAFASTAFAAADKNDFLLVSKSGKNIGRASYTLSKGKNGVTKVTSSFQYRISTPGISDSGASDPSTGMTVSTGVPNEGQFTFEYTADDSGDVLGAFTTNATNQMITSFQVAKPDKTQLTIGSVQGGVQGMSRTLTAPRPDYLVAPDYDPSALQVLLSGAAAHPHADRVYVLIVPGSAPVGPKAQTNAVPVGLDPGPDATGTLDGKPVTLKHTVMRYNKGSADLYTDADGKLMEADMGPLNVNYVRAKFKMDAAAAK